MVKVLIYQIGKSRVIRCLVCATNTTLSCVYGRDIREVGIGGVM